MKEDQLTEQTDQDVDVSLIAEAMTLTPTERWKRHQAVLDFLLEIKRASYSRLPPSNLPSPR